MIALGCDPGLAHVGLALVRRDGQGHALIAAKTLSTTPADGDDTTRGRLVGEWLSGLLVGWSCSSLYPHVAGIEDVEVRRHGGDKIDPRGMLATARVLGRVEVTLGRECQVYVLRASDWRRAIGAGHGTAAEVRRAVERHVTLPARCSVHAVDAVGIALAVLARAS